MTDEGSRSVDRTRLEQINARLNEIAGLLGNPATTDSEATGLAGEAARLVAEALEETERAVAALEPRD